jgi:hypothetical protein
MASRILAVLIFVFGSIHAALPQAAAASPAGPTLLLSPTPRPGLVRVEFRNSSAQDLVLNLGIALGNGAKQYPMAINLALTTPDGRTLHLEPMGPGFVAGRIDPLVVPLPAGATYSFLADLKQYWAPKDKIWGFNLPPGRYTIQAEYTGRGLSQLQANLDMKGIVLMPYWIGTVTTTPLMFTVASNETVAPDGEKALNR